MVRGGKKVALFLLDESLTKQKVMTCEVVLTDAAAWLFPFAGAPAGLSCRLRNHSTGGKTSY